MEVYQPLISFDWNLLFSMATFICLFLILKHFFFDKVRKFMEQREQGVANQLAEAKQAEEEANTRLAQYENIVGQAEEKGREIVKESKKIADERAESIIKEAQGEAAAIVRKAEEKAEDEKARALLEMKKEIAELAITAAEQIVGREVEDKGEDVIIDKIIEEAGAGKWQN